MTNTWLLPPALMLASALAQETPSPDWALVVSLEGEPQLQRANEAAPGPLTPWDKVYRDDRIQLPELGAVELRFMDSRLLRWIGPLELVVGEGDAQAAVGTTPPELQAVVVLLRRVELGEGGHTLIRGEEGEPVELSDDERASLAKARAAYATQRASAAADGILPEMVLISVLATFGQREELLAMLDLAVARCGRCPAARALQAALRVD